MTKKQRDQLASAKKRLRRIEGLLGPYKKDSTAEFYSSRGKWQSGREILTEQQKHKGAAAAAKV